VTQRHLLIAGAHVVTQDALGRILPEADVHVTDGAITHVGPAGGAAGLAEGERIDGRGKLLIPGLVNAHTHSPAAYAKGTVDRMDHPRFMWRNQGDTCARTAEEIHNCTLLAALEMLESGTTAVIDNYPEQPFGEAQVEPAVQAYREIGLRATLALRVYDEPYHDILPPAGTVLPPELQAQLDASPLAPRPAREQLDLCRRIIERWHEGDDGLVNVMVAPSAPLRCSDDFLRGIAQISREYGVGVHTHLLETPVQVEICRARYGKTLVQRLADLDLLGPRLSCAHGIYVSDDDIRLLAQSGTTVVHNPVSNLRIGDGIAPVVKMHRRGVPIALGTDGMSTNDNMNLFEELKLAATLHRCSGHPMSEWLSVAEALALATLGGARALCKPHLLGSIEPGKRADMVLLDLDSIPFTPLNAPLCQLVYAGADRAVDTVIVDGHVVVRAGEVARVDRRAVMRDARKLRAASQARNGAIYEFTERLMPYLLQTN